MSLDEKGAASTLKWLPRSCDDAMKPGDDHTGRVQAHQGSQMIAANQIAANQNATILGGIGDGGSVRRVAGSCATIVPADMTATSKVPPAAWSSRVAQPLYPGLA